MLNAALIKILQVIGTFAERIPYPLLHSVMAHKHLFLAISFSI